MLGIGIAFDAMFDRADALCRAVPLLASRVGTIDFDIPTGGFRLKLLCLNQSSPLPFIEGLLQRLGLAEQAEAKAMRYAGSEMLEHVISGKGKELAFSPITEILLYRDKGLQLVGPLPAEIQNFTAYAAEPGLQSEAALVFVRFLGTPAAKAIFVAAGVE